MPAYYVAVDVGTRSARAAVFDACGGMLGRCVLALDLAEDGAGLAEYSSAQIREAVTGAIAGALSDSGVPGHEVAGLGFDATCSLVLSARDGTPLTLGGDGRDTLAWCDHRATEEARICTLTGHPLIGLQGGAMSPEMQSPKLLWLKRHRPDLWARLGRAEDLADHLTRRATGAAGVSRCTLVTKWPYLPGRGGWQQDFLGLVGLDDLPARMPLADPPLPVGTRQGGLLPEMAARTGLPPGLPVGTGLIDAYAGGLGMMAFAPGPPGRPHLGVIAGTSACVTLSGPEPVSDARLWGPYDGAVLPGQWISEGGLSAAGAGLDRILAGWRGAGGPPGHRDVLERLPALLARDGLELGRDLPLLPDFSGQRAPFLGLTRRDTAPPPAAESFDRLCARYWRGALATALAIRHVIEVLGGAAIDSEVLTVTGGLGRHGLFAQLLADATGRTVRRATEADAVLLGTMITARAAAEGGGLARALAQVRPGITDTRPSAAQRTAFDRAYGMFLQDLGRIARGTDPALARP